MSLKKFLERCGLDCKPNKNLGLFSRFCSLTRPQSHSGQAIIEYFILLVLLTAISIIGSSVFFHRVQESVINFEGNCFNALGQEFTAYSDWQEENPWWNVAVIEGGEQERGEADPPPQTNW